MVLHAVWEVSEGHTIEVAEFVSERNGESSQYKLVVDLALLVSWHVAGFDEVLQVLECIGVEELEVALPEDA